MVQTKMGRYWFQKKGWFIRKMWPFKTESGCKEEDSQRASAVRRKRAAGNTGPKPTNVRTFAKRKKMGMGGLV